MDVQEPIQNGMPKSTLADEPHLQACDPDERKVARRLRIQRRLEVSKKPKSTGKKDETPSDRDKLPVINQAEQSEELLNQLLKEGQELVTNVQIANDSREKKRRSEELMLSQLRRERLEAEAESGEKQLKEITDCWSRIALNHDVLGLHEDIQRQKARCENLIRDKNSLIKSLNEELSHTDDCYVKDLSKQAEDIALCAERIDSQVEIMTRAYKLELSLLEMTIQKEHKELVEQGNDQWNGLYRKREEVVDKQMKERVCRVAQQQEGTFNTHIDFAEKYRQVKIALESDIQLLQQEIEKIKATCMLNSEKLDYNFQVLKKKDEESTILKSKQKRKITKLLDSISNLRSTIEEIQQNTKTESVRLTEEVMKLHRNIMEIEEKSSLFAKINDNRYINVWKMNESNVLGLIKKVLDADRVIYEHQLCLDWTPPDMSFVNKTPLKIKEISAQPTLEEDIVIPTEPLSEQKRRLLCHLFEKLANSSGFLLEKHIHALLAPYSAQESTLICVDNIFMALGVKTMKDIDILLDYFYPYLECPICNGMEAVMKSDLHHEEKSSSIEEVVEDKRPQLDLKEQLSSENMHFRLVSTGTDKDSMLYSDKENPMAKKLAEMKEDMAADYSHEQKSDISVVTTSPPCEVTRDKDAFSCPNAHPLQMNSIYVLKAIQEFASHVHDLCYGADKVISDSKQKKVLSSREISKDAVEEYWGSFLQVLPKRKEKLWDGLLIGLQKYYLILQDRHQLVEETSKLRSQNAELRQLLHSYINSNV